jgi:hypothetical protein
VRQFAEVGPSFPVKPQVVKSAAVLNGPITFEEKGALPVAFSAVTRANTYLLSAAPDGTHVLAVALSTTWQLVPFAFAQAIHW